MRWAEIKAAASEEAADLVGNIMMEEGCGGVAIAGPFVRASDRAELPADLPRPDHTTVTGYLPVDDRLEGRLESIRERFRLLPETGTDIGPGQITVTLVEDADWADAWRSFFKTILTGRILIKPSWEEIEVGPGQIVVEIDPGMAFGTGNHPTTQLCLLALQNYVAGGEKVLDVGTGSGILAIAAAKLGAEKVAATEIDRAAAEAARRNVERNGLEDRVTVYQTDTPESGPGEFDIAVANITADPIMALAPALARAVRKGGMLIVSGIITSRADEVTSRLREHGFQVVDTTTEDDWVAAVLKRER